MDPKAWFKDKRKLKDSAKEQNEQVYHNKALSFTDATQSTVVSFYESLLKKEQDERLD